MFFLTHSVVVVKFARFWFVIGYNMLVRTPPICLEAKAYSKDASQFAAEVSVAQRQANRQQKSWT